MSLPLRYLNYHAVPAEPSPFLYSLPATEFEAHLGLLTAPPAGSRARLGVTFDDGLRTQYEQAFPALEKHGVRAIFFVTAGFTGTEARYMSWPQLRELAAAGHEVQAHGWMHRFLTHCTAKQLDDELRRPKETLEDHLGQPVDAFSFPGGRWDDRTLEACGRVGYRRAFTSELWPPDREQGGIRIFGRYTVQSDTSVGDLAHVMRSGGEPSRRQKALLAAKKGFRRVLGDERYHRLWCLLARGDPGAEQNAGGSGR